MAENVTPQQGKAIASLVVGIVGLVVTFSGIGAIFGLIAGIVGIVLARMAKKELVEGQGSGMITAGLVCSIITVVISAIALVSVLGLGIGMMSLLH